MSDNSTKNLQLDLDDIAVMLAEATKIEDSFQRSVALMAAAGRAMQVSVGAAVESAIYPLAQLRAASPEAVIKVDAIIKLLEHMKRCIDELPLISLQDFRG